MKQKQFLAAGLLLLAAALPVSAADSGLSAQLRQVVENNLAAYNREDPAGTLSTIDSKSPVYASMQEALPLQFGAMNARTSLERLHYIGSDGEFAVARVHYRTVDDSTEPFLDNITDTIAIFHREGGAWKYWDQQILGVRLAGE